MYGISLFLGIFLATLIGERLCKKRALDLQLFWRAVFYALLFGLLGARLYHVVHRIDYFAQHPLEIIAVWQGGLGIWGGILGGLLGLFLSTPKTGRLFEYADVFAVCAPLAQAVGRLGNYFNKELFGYPTDLPWGIYIPQELRPSAFKYYDRFHPLFLYESLLNLLLFVVLYRFFDRRRAEGTKQKSGVVTLAYLAGYSFIRFFLEFLKPNVWSAFGFPVAGIVSLLVFLLSVLAIYRARLKAA
jgi:phosphatidylglycerol:prolipoprotein diacylglycerol transferase